MDGTIGTADGRTVGFADYGTRDQTALLWCHGGPEHRHEPSLVADSAARAGIRLIGIDRPGYGCSTPQPGRTIGGWVADALAVLDHLAEMFAQGVVGFVDDRLADVNGWGSFDVTKTSCPVTVMHGTSDGLVPVATAHHTAALVPGATLRIFADLGHLSILTRTIDVASKLLTTCMVTR